MKYRPYPAYKPSGVAWLGEVPEHWEMKRLDFVASVKGRLGWKGLTADEYVSEGYIFLATPNIKGEDDIDFENVNYITAERYFESPEIMLQVGDVLIAKDGSTLGITNVVRHLPAPATVNSSIAVLRPKPGSDNRYLFRWLSGEFMQAIIHSYKDGQGVPHLFQADIKKFHVLTPPLCEQRAIADFLDAETAKLETLIAKKRELIEKLKEKRTALISRTVTRGLPPDGACAAGLNPNPKLKPSGIKWLGDIPEHWEVSRLGYLVSKVGSGKTPKGGAEVYQSEGVMLIRSQNVHESGLRLTDVVFIDKSIDEEMSETRVFPKDVLLNITGASLGRCAVVPDSFGGANVNQHVCILRPEPSKAEGRFIQRVISSEAVQSQIFSFENGSSREGLNFQQVRSLLVALPAVPEQRAVADYLDGETAKIDRMAAKIEKAIERLQEYRTALITAAVTGKIDVRGYARATEAA